jgi:hypothetical protein
VGDRFPLLLVGLLVLFGVVGAFLFQGAQRGAFADRLSTYRSEPDGARALYLVLQQQQVPVARLEESLDLIPKGQSLMLLGVRFEHEREPVGPWFDGSDAGVDPADAGAERLDWAALRAPHVDPDEATKLLEHARSGATVVLTLAGPRANTLLDELEVTVVPAAPSLGLRTIVPAQPSRFTRGAQHLEAPVEAFLQLPPGAVPLLLDAELDEVVAALVPVGAGRVIVIGASGLAMNRHLAKADNARFWSSLVVALAAGGPVAFDEYHHGFDGQRSMGAFASRHGLQYAIAQLLLGLGLWALALRRFGRPRGVQAETRVGSTGMLLATSRIYREGRHQAHAAQAISRGLLAELAARAGLNAQSSPEQVAQTLSSRGRADLARALSDVTREAAHVTSEAGLHTVARLSALVRRQLHHTSRTK